MSLLGNIIWFLFGGFVQAVGWTLGGILCYITVIGIPAGQQCFKLARLQLAPFGKNVVYRGSSVWGLLGNILWLVFLGWELFLANLAAALLFAVTIVGFPFALQSLKLARVSLFPFGMEIIRRP